MARTLWHTLLWIAWSVPAATICAVVYMAVVVPIWVGYTPSFSGNLTALAMSAISVSALVPFCVLPWLAIAWMVPLVERNRISLAIGFVVWVCLLGELTTVFMYGDEPSFAHLVPYSFGAIAILSPRFLVPSLASARTFRAPSHGPLGARE